MPIFSKSHPERFLGKNKLKFLVPGNDVCFISGKVPCTTNLIGVLTSPLLSLYFPVFPQFLSIEYSRFGLLF